MKPLWKVTTTYGSVMGIALKMKPLEETRVYRWRWRARLAAFNRCYFAWGFWSNSIVEPYWPQANVISLPRRRA